MDDLKEFVYSHKQSLLESVKTKWSYEEPFTEKLCIDKLILCFEQADNIDTAREYYTVLWFSISDYQIIGLFGDQDDLTRRDTIWGRINKIQKNHTNKPLDWDDMF